MYPIWYNGCVIIFEEEPMDSLEPKKLALLRILQIFKKYSDFDHPLKQEDIARLLDEDYGIVIERKAISRNVALLKDAGFEIESSHAGSYLDERDFTDSELRLLIDGVLSSKYITARYSKELIGKQPFDHHASVFTFTMNQFHKILLYFKQHKLQIILS